MHNLEFIGFGLLVGAYGTLVGSGGGFLIVPTLLLIYHATPQQAAGTSIAVVFLNALSGTVSYARQRRVDYKAGVAFSMATIPGAIAGAFLTSLVAGRAFDVLFSTLLICLAAFLLWKPLRDQATHEVDVSHVPRRWLIERELSDAYGERYKYHYDLRRGIVLSLFIGVFSSLLGIGGGIIHVPVLIHLLGFPAHLATATSHFILVITAAIGTITHMGLGHVLWGPAIFMGIGVIAGAQFGAWFGQRVGGALMVRLLSVALIVVGLRLLFR
jgi:uncharacterized membrane protein YfcA